LINSQLRDRLVDTIALLNIPGVGRGRFTRLVKQFGSAGEALAARREDLIAVPGLSEKTADAIKSGYDGDRARQIAARIVQLGWDVLFPDIDGYPPMLKQIHDCPPVLFRTGQTPTGDEKCIAIVGTRHASEAGRRFTAGLAAGLVEAGLTVVSGMAEGIDSAAHRGALSAGGKTWAVWGTPLDKVYPQSNVELAGHIRANGAVFSEYFPDIPFEPSNFPERNRIISGLSEGVIVVEASHRSGALITAQYAIDQGREIFAVPGSPGNKRSIGTNGLIKMGAKLLTCANDVLDEIPRLKGEIIARRFKQEPDLTEIERRIVDCLAREACQIDTLCREVKLPVSELMEYLLALELKGVVEELSGKRFVLADR
jgi:DNA processing protein